MWDDNSQPDVSGEDWLEGSVDHPFTDWSSLPQSMDGDHPFDVPESERYRWVSDIGSGGMGRIDSVEDLRLGRVVARKRSLRGAGNVHRNDRRMSREAWITAQLEHPGIVAVHDVGRDDGGGLFFTMRLVRGKTLGSELAAAKTLKDRLGLLRALRDACEAVGFAHHQGMVHRDLKPQNIMVGRFGETQVMDWGLATPVPGPAGDWWRKLFPPQLGVSTVHGAVLGTAWYLSPEQVEGREVGPRSDVWSLGVVLYELMSGERPFQGSDFRTVTTRIASSQPVPLSSRSPTLPAGLVEICERAMSPVPANRYADGKALADAITAWMSVGMRRSAPVSSAASGVRPARLWTHALVLGVGVLATAGWAHLERASLVEASAQRESTVTGELASARAELARAAFEEGRVGVAEDWALKSLDHGHAPSAVGVLMGTALAARVTPMEPTDLPACRERSIDPTGRWMTCTTEREVQQWSLEPLAQVWSVELADAVRPRVGADGTVLVRTDTEAFLFGDRGQVLRSSNVGGGGQLAYAPAEELLWKADHELLVSAPIQDDTEQRFRSREQRWFLAADCGHLLALHESLTVTTCGTNLRVVDRGSLRSILLPELEREQHVDALVTDGESVWVGGGRGGLARVELAEDRLVWETSVGSGSLQSIVQSADGQWLVVRHDLSELSIVSAETGVRVATLKDDHVGAPMRFDGEMLDVYGAQLHRYQIALNTSDLQVVGVGPGVTSLAFSPDGETLAVGHGRGLRQLTVASGAIAVDTPTEAVVKDVVWGPTGDLFAALSMPMQEAEDAAPWNVLHQPAGGPPERIAVGGPGFRRMTLLGESLLIYTGYTVGPSSWDFSTGAPGPKVAQVGGVPTDLEPASSGQAVGWVGTEGVWWLSTDQLTPRRIVAEADSHTIALSPDGEQVFLGEPSTIECVQARDGSTCWDAPLSVEHAPIDLATSSDGRFLVAGMRNGETMVVSAVDGSVLAVAGGHVDKVAAVAVSPDGRLLVTGSWDGTVRFWSTEPLEHVRGQWQDMARSD